MTLARFERFLGSLDLESYRRRYARIKTVELDLPRGIQPLRQMYEVYWDGRNPEGWLRYEEFYAHYRSDIRPRLEEFREAHGFSHETFYLGLPARIYRTWASILTQIQAAYVLEGIYGPGKVRMGVELDRSGTDIAVRCFGEHDLFIQVKKMTKRGDLGGGTAPRRRPKKKKVRLTYAVPSGKRHLRQKFDGDGNPLPRELSKPHRDWESEWGDRLTYLDNGFVIFRPAYFDLGNLIDEFAREDAAA